MEALKMSDTRIVERQLEDALKQHISMVEEGLEVIQNQFPTLTGPVDILCVDPEGAPVVMELKVNQDDSMLFQALRYYAHIEKTKASLKLYHSEKIDEQKKTRIILLAPSFSDPMKDIVSILSDIDITLVEFLIVQTSEGREGIICRPIESISPPPPPPPPTEADHIEYITNPEIKGFCSQIVQWFKGKDLDSSPVQSYLGFKKEGRVYAAIWTRRKYFYIGFADPQTQEWNDFGNVDSQERFNELLGDLTCTYS